MAAVAKTSSKAGSHPYHHGDLRAALVAGARDILRERGHDKFSLNELARRIGVSAGAVYRHFANVEALLRAVSFEGYGELQAALTRPYAADLNPGGRLLGMGVRYVAFSAENTDLFLTMFRFRPTSEADMRGADAFSPLVEAVAAAQETGQMPSGDSRQLAMVIWSSLHGLAVLYLNGSLVSLGLVDNLREAARTSLTLQFPRLGVPIP